MKGPCFLFFQSRQKKEVAWNKLFPNLIKFYKKATGLMEN